METAEEETVEEVKPEAVVSADIDYTFEPVQLMVFRDTVIKFTVTGLSAGDKCFWDFGDDEQGKECQATHVYHGGLKDQFATLVVKSPDGKKIHEQTVKIPLDRQSSIRIFVSAFFSL